MGYQTNISILNDHFDWIEKNPKTFVKAIKYGMNDGTESMVTETFQHKYAKNRGDTSYDPYGNNSPEEREASNHYVTVHKAQHADVPQVIYTHRNSAFDVYDFKRGIELGFLDRKSNPETWCKIGKEMAKELRRQAKDLDRAIKEYEGLAN